MDPMLQRKLVTALQGDIPLEEEPFKKIAVELGTSQEELLAYLEQMIEEGILKRVGAVLYHRRVGFTDNAMVAWRARKETVDAAGFALASFPEASHVYRRPAHSGWEYNLYTMVHGTSREECEKIIARMAQYSGLEDYVILYSTREFKKTSMAYYPEII